MSASPKPPDPFEDKERIEQEAKDRVAATLRMARQIVAAREAERMRETSGGSDGPPPTQDVEKTIHNEKVKLSASWLNSLSLAFLAGSGVTTVLGVGSLPDPNDQLLRGFLWVVAGLALHALARAHLGSLK